MHMCVCSFTSIDVYEYKCVINYQTTYIYYYIIYIYMYRNIMNTTRARASWVTQVSKRVEAHEEKGEPLGTTPDCLAVTAVGCVSLSA